jgi:hypothetical protein
MFPKKKLESGQKVGLGGVPLESPTVMFLVLLNIFIQFKVNQPFIHVCNLCRTKTLKRGHFLVKMTLLGVLLSVGQGV